MKRKLQLPSPHRHLGTDNKTERGEEELGADRVERWQGSNRSRMFAKQPTPPRLINTQMGCTQKTPLAQKCCQAVPTMHVNLALIFVGFGQAVESCAACG